MVLHNRRDDGFECEEVLDFGVRNAEEGQLQQEIQDKTNHSGGADALRYGDVVLDVGEGGPNGCEQDCHALAASCCLHAADCQLFHERVRVDGSVYPSHTMARTHRDSTTKYDK